MKIFIKKYLFILIILHITFLYFACGSSSITINLPIDDEIPPYIVSINFYNEYPEISSQIIIEIIFSEQMDTTSFETNGFFSWFTGSLSTIEMPSLVLWTSNNTILLYGWSELQPFPFETNITYSIQTRTDIYSPTDLAGNKLLSYYNYFTPVTDTNNIGSVNFDWEDYYPVITIIYQNNNYTVKWDTVTPDAIYILQESNVQSFDNILNEYEMNTNEKIFINQTPGNYYYRVIIKNTYFENNWSQTRHINVSETGSGIITW